MIQELKIMNFLSFKDEVTLSFEASKDTFNEPNQVVEVAPGIRLLRFAILFGANASGKSNLLNAIEFLNDFWFEVKKDLSETTGVIPFKLDRFTPNQPSSFSLKFFVNQTRYWYQLQLDEKKVVSESLHYYKSVQPTMLFERVWENNISKVNFNSKVLKVSQVAKEEINIKCLPNMSFFAARNQVNISLPEIDAAKDWMRKNMMSVIVPNLNLFRYAEKNMMENNNIKDYLLDFIKKADFNITNIQSEVIKQDIPQDFLDILLKNEDIPVIEKERLKSERKIQKISTEFEHSVINERGIENYLLPTNLQSDGTRRIVGIEAAFFNLIENNAFLAIDELESSLHPELLEFVIQEFLQKRDTRSQLLVTTHYDPLLNLIDDLFRKDSVWFTEKHESGHSDLYSLVEFKGLSRLSSLQKAYRNGLFGALPKINS